jgi:hypothetical protein
MKSVVDAVSRDRSTAYHDQVTPVTAASHCVRHRGCAGREMSRTVNTGEKKMEISMNDSLANCELSIENLEAIAAGNIFGDFGRWVKREVNDGIHWLESPQGKDAIAKGVGAGVDYLLHLL